MNYYSTEPTRTILDRLHCPDEKLKIIHIAGTNGKGSTAEFFTNVLICANKKTGTFTSPLVYTYNDQFRINGVSLTDEKLNYYIGKAASAAQGVNASQFEIETAGIIYAFAEEGCEWAVIECGMGGLTDATNAVSHKELAVITSVSLEHTEYLGKTIKDICAHKAGIIKNCPAVVNARQPDEAAEYFKNLGVVFADKNIADDFEISARGSLQVYNAATAIVGARLLGFDEIAIREGIKNTKPAGRLETVNICGRTYILDGAHNPAAFEPLKDILSERAAEDTAIIFGCLSDKDIDGNLKALQGLAKRITAVPGPSPRSRSLRETSVACKKYFNNVGMAQSVECALEAENAQTVVVCGSFTLLSEAKQWIENLTGKRQ